MARLATKSAMTRPAARATWRVWVGGAVFTLTQYLANHLVAYWTRRLTAETQRAPSFY